MAHAFCMNGIVHWKGDKLWILCTQKMSAKGEKVYVTNPSNEHNTFWTCPFHKTPNPKKPYHLLHNKERFKCIEVNMGMQGDQRHLVGTNSWTSIFHKASKP